jgi:hypothetical protein
VQDLIAATVDMLALLRSADVGQYIARHAEQHVVQPSAIRQTFFSGLI